MTPDPPAAGHPPDRRQELYAELLVERFAPVPRKPQPRDDTERDREHRRRTLTHPPEENEC